jgi:hypothetical protein
MHSGIIAAEVTFGDWSVVRADNGDMVAGTHQDNYSKVLIYRCFKSQKQCAHVVIVDVECDDGHSYPILVNSSHAALSMDAVCSVNDGRGELVLSEFDAVHEILQKADVVGFAVPMQSGQFKVVRFSLNGSARAMEHAERKLTDSSEYL